MHFLNYFSDKGSFYNFFFVVFVLRYLFIFIGSFYDFFLYENIWYEDCFLVKDRMMEDPWIHETLTYFKVWMSDCLLFAESSSE